MVKIKLSTICMKQHQKFCIIPVCNELFSHISVYYLHSNKEKG